MIFFYFRYSYSIRERNADNIKHCMYYIIVNTRISYKMHKSLCHSLKTDEGRNEKNMT